MLKRQNFLELDEYKDFIPICTDGSKEGRKVGSASFENHAKSKIRLPDNAFIFTVEARAINLALSYISQKLTDKFVYFF